MIKEIYYNNFKCFKETKLSIEKLTTIIGTNSSGKTNAIEGMIILSEIVTGIDLETIFNGTKNRDSEIRGGSKGCCRFRHNRFVLGCTILIDSATELVYRITINAADRPVVEEESLVEKSQKEDRKGSAVVSEKTLFKTKWSSDDSGDIAVSINNGVKGRNPDINCIKYYSSISQIVSKLSTEKAYGKLIVGYCEKIISDLKSILYLNPNPALMRDYSQQGNNKIMVTAANISSVLSNLCSVIEIKEKIISFMRKLSENEIVDISFGQGQMNDVILFLVENFGCVGNQEKVNAKQLSDGTLRCLAILAAVYSESVNGMIVIEEIDNGIHPGRAKLLIKEISRITKERNITLVFTTHNPVLLNSLNKEELFGVNLIYRDTQSGDGRIVRLTEMDNLPELLTSGKLGDVFYNDEILYFIKGEEKAVNPRWLEV